MNRKQGWAALALALATAGAAAQVAPTALEALLQQQRGLGNVYRAQAPTSELARRAAITFHAALLESDLAARTLVLELEPDEVRRLRESGFSVEPAPDAVVRRDALLDQLQAETALRRQADPAARSATIASIPSFSCYETVEETYAAAQALVARYPGLATLVPIGTSWSGAYRLMVLKIRNERVSGVKPKLFAQSAIHAREYATAPLALSFARWLLDGHATNADAHWIVDHHEVHLLLHANPDGRKIAEGGVLWRKNTNSAYCPHRPAQRGADLNRNFSFGWNSTGGSGSSGNACDPTYRGAGAGSEPEVRAIQTYARGLWADRRGPGAGDAAPADTSGLHLDIHSFSELVLWPWGTTSTPAPNGTALQTLGRKLAFLNGYHPEQSIGLYPTDGTSDGISYGELGVPAYTIELGRSFFESCADFASTTLPKNLPVLAYAAKVARTPYLTASGPDVTSAALSVNRVAAGTPVPLSAQASDARFSTANGSEPVQPITRAEAYIDLAPWNAGAMAIPLAAADGSFDRPTEALTATLDTSALSAGQHVVFVRAGDAAQWGAPSAVFLDITTGPPPPISMTLLGIGPPRARALRVGWNGAFGPRVDILLDGRRAITTPNDRDQILRPGPGLWRVQVCQSGATVCSPEQTIAL